MWRLFQLHNPVKQCLPRLRDTSVWVFAGCVMAMVAFGRAIADDAHGGVGRSLVYVIVFGAGAWLVGSLIFGWFDRMSDSRVQTGSGAPGRFWLERQPSITYTASLRRYGGWVFLAILVCWLPWIIVCWPGVLRDDTIAQFMQSAGYKAYYAQHPLFDTLIFGLFWHIGYALHDPMLGMGIYVAVQAIAFALNVALIVCYLRKLGAARSLLLVVTLFFACCPAIVGAVPTISKDSLHAVFLMPLAVIFTEACLTRGAVLARNPVRAALIVLIICCALSKRTAVMVIVASFLILIIAAKRKRDRIAAAICVLAALTISQGIIEPALERATHAEAGTSKEAAALILHPISRVAAHHPERITPQEWRELGHVVDLHASAAHYVSYRTDETAWYVNPNATPSQWAGAAKAWCAIGLREPGEYLRTYGNLTLGWYYPRTAVYYGWNNDILFTPQYMQQWSTFVPPPNTAEQVLQPMREPSQASLGGTGVSRGVVPRVLAATAHVGERIGASAALNAHAYYATYLPLAMLIYGVSRRCWRAVIAGSFLGINVLVLYLSPLVFPWYLLPVVFILPLFVGVTGACTADGDRSAIARVEGAVPQIVP